MRYEELTHGDFQVLACCTRSQSKRRLRLRAREASSVPIEALFQESGLGSPVGCDTASLTNRSGSPLTDVIVVRELTGASGDTFDSCYCAESWESG